MSMIGHFVSIEPAQLAELLNDSTQSVNIFLAGGDVSQANLDIDKAWHGIHFLLTGEAWGGEPPAALAILGGTEIGEDIGYGPARYLSVEEVRTVAATLAATPRNVIAERYQPEAMERAGVYP